MRIIGPASVTLPTVIANLPVRGGLFEMQMLLPLWDAGVSLLVDQVGVIAQAGKETNWGRFGGKVLPEFCNPCGLKNRNLGLFPGVDDGDNPMAHARFPSWQVGAIAQVQHLRAYAGYPLTADEGLIVDPRYSLVVGKWSETFEELGGKWAPAADYGTQLVATARKLQGMV